MLSIGKLARGQEGYYLGSVARGVEDYYLAGEQTGVWIGAGAVDLGLVDAVAAAGLSMVMDGVDPRSGGALRANPKVGVPGFDLTFRAPKSVSVLYGIGDRVVVDKILRAHHDAVTAGFGYLERQAAWTRRGHGGARLVRGTGLVGAGFTHGTSRAGDPHLHTHVVVANVVHGVDGAWGSLDARHLWRCQMDCVRGWSAS